MRRCGRVSTAIRPSKGASESTKTRVLEDRISSFIAAKELLEIYFKDRAGKPE